MDPEVPEVIIPEDTLAEVDNDPGNYVDNPGFRGSDESLPSVIKSSVSYASIDD